MPHPCPEKDRLRKLYAEALNALVNATNLLRWAQYGPEFQNSLETTQQARTRYEGARLALEDHRKQHGC